MGLLKNLLTRSGVVSPAYAELISQWLDDEDDWVSQPEELSHSWFGSPVPFADFLLGDSVVQTADLAAVYAWLRRCEYHSDADLFGKDDLWVHPRSFEDLRMGDCEDHALWAWKKLGELGFDPYFVIGEATLSPRGRTRHAWVTFQDEEGEWIVETTAKDPHPIQLPFDLARDGYTPHGSIRYSGETRLYGGFIAYRHWFSQRRIRRFFDKIGEALK